jgi:hypothetical protein
MTTEEIDAEFEKKFGKIDFSNIKTFGDLNGIDKDYKWFADLRTGRPICVKRDEISNHVVIDETGNVSLTQEGIADIKPPTVKVHELLSDESKWTKGEYARDKDGKPCHSRSQEAVKWCVLGAVNKCYEKQTSLAYIVAQKLIKAATKNLSTEEIKRIKMNVIDHWNDNNDYKTIYNALKEMDI